MQPTENHDLLIEPFIGDTAGTINRQSGDKVFVIKFDDIPLPPGWGERLSTEDKVYYVNDETQTTQWHHPEAAVFASASLPSTPAVSTTDEVTTAAAAAVPGTE